MAKNKTSAPTLPDASNPPPGITPEQWSQYLSQVGQFAPSLQPQQGTAAQQFMQSPTAHSIEASGGELGGYQGFEGPDPTGGGKKAAPAAAAPATKAGAPPPTYDPLALQQMWANVFGPIFNQTAKMMGNIGPDYLTAMSNAIGGSNQSAQAKAQQLSQAKAMSDLLNQYGQSNLQQVATGPTLDTLMGWLQQATGAAQQAQGVAEKNIAYGGSVLNAQALGVNSPATSSAGATGTTISPQQAAALTQSALSGNQTGSATGGSTNPLNPTQLLQAQGLGSPAGSTIP